ncbi:MAG: cyclic nucleotide-binding domain-containing protein [Vulcanococcus sp.]
MASSNTTDLFASLFYAWAQQNGDELRLDASQELIREGEPTPDLFILVEGGGLVRTASLEGDAVELAEIGPGQFVGEMSLLEERLPVATVEALPGSRWIRVNHQRLLRAIEQDKPLGASTYLVFAGKLARQLSSQNAFIHRWPGRDVEPLRKVLLVFGEWNELDVAWLAGQGSRVEAEADVPLIRQGQNLEHLYVVLHGEAEVQIDVEGSPTPVGSSRRGEILGEMSFLGGDDRATASVLPRETLTVLAVPKASIRSRLQEDMAFAERFHRSLAVLLSHRCRDQLMSRGLAARAAALEELDLTTLRNVSTAGRRFEWLCEAMTGAR